MASASAVKGLPTSFSQCPGFFLGRQPPAVKGGHALRELCFDGFAVLHSGLTRTPVFAAQRLNRKSLGGIPRQRSDRFFADARLRSAERATLDDYRRSGYSRGHLAPSADMATEAAMAQSFSLANMVPQSLRHNSGAWAKIEQDTRKYVQRAKGDVHVVTGAVFGSKVERIGPTAWPYLAICSSWSTTCTPARPGRTGRPTATTSGPAGRSATRNWCGARPSNGCRCCSVTGGGDCGRDARGPGSGATARSPSGPASIQGKLGGRSNDIRLKYQPSLAVVPR